MPAGDRDGISAVVGKFTSNIISFTVGYINKCPVENFAISPK